MVNGGAHRSIGLEHTQIRPIILYEEPVVSIKCEETIVSAQWAKSPKKGVCRSVFLTIFECRINKNANALLQTVFWRFCPLGKSLFT